MTKKLNQRQQAFIEAYSIPGTERYGNATESALYAGYSKKTAYSQGSALLKKPEILKAIEGVREKLFDENIMTGKEVLYHLTRTARAETREIDAVVAKTAEYIENPNNPDKSVLVYNEHIEMISKPPKVSDQNKALELLGKHHKLWTEKQEIEHTGIDIVIDYGDDDDDEAES